MQELWEKIANNPSEEYLDTLKFKLSVSIDKHHSKGILVDGHQECAGNPVEDAKHKEDILRSVEVIKQLSENKVPVIGVFVIRSENQWVVEELHS